MWARFTVLNETPIASAIAGCVIPLSRSNTIWMRSRCAAGIFHRSAVFSCRICFLVHLTIRPPESDSQSESYRAIELRARKRPQTTRFNQLWKRYYTPFPQELGNVPTADIRGGLVLPGFTARSSKIRTACIGTRSTLQRTHAWSQPELPSLAHRQGTGHRLHACHFRSFVSIDQI